MKFEESFLPPSPDEISGRIAAVQAQMARENLDWYVCFDPDNVYYLTNFANFVHERPFIILIPAVGPVRFIVPKLEIPHVLSRKVGEIDLVEYFEFPAPSGGNWYDLLQSVIGGARRVGVESVCQLQIYDAIPAERVRTDIVDRLRFIKSPYEISRMVYAGRIASAAMADLLAKADVGRPVSTVSSEASKLMMGMIARDNPSINPFATRAAAVFQSPRYSDDPHNFTDLAMAMEEGGPHVALVAPRLNGYASEIERTFFLGHVPEAARRPYDVMMEARHLAFALTLPGARMSDVDKAVNALFVERGYADNLLHRTGHGMGVTGHEAPFLAEGDERIIEPGMSLTIEPGIYLPGVGGFRHSDTIIITEAGNRLLTHGPESRDDLTL
jgi:Xaa-Pro dipeptidase